MLGKRAPVVDVLAIAAPFLLWPAFDGLSPTAGRVAFYSMSGLLVAYLGWRLRSVAGWQWIPVMLFSWFVGGQQFVCGLLFEHNGKHICDAGTGIPWVLITGAALAVIAAYYASRSTE